MNEDFSIKTYKWVNKNKGLALFFYTILYSIIKLILWLLKDSAFFDYDNFVCKLLKSIGNDVFSNMDILGYLIGLLTFYFGLKITFLLDDNQTEKQMELKDVLSQIKSTSDNLSNLTAQIDSRTENLTDAIRKFHSTFPSLFDEIKKILSKDLGSNGKLYIMNRTSSFGRIHAYNPRFAYEFIEENPMANENHYDISGKKYKYVTEDFKKGVRAFNNRIDEIEQLVLNKCQSKNIKFLFYCENELKEKFIKDYFKSENGENELVYFEYKEGQVVPDKNMNKEEKEKKITDAVVEFHGKALGKMKDKRGDNQTGFGYQDIDSFIKTTSSLADIPMQMYLAEYEKDGRKNFETLVIFAVDEDGNTLDNGDKMRTLIGISSSIEKMYRVFETFFAEPFSNQNNNNNSKKDEK